MVNKLPSAVLTYTFGFLSASQLGNVGPPVDSPYICRWMWWITAYIHMLMYHRLSSFLPSSTLTGRSGLYKLERYCFDGCDLETHLHQAFPLSRSQRSDWSTPFQGFVQGETNTRKERREKGNIVRVNNVTPCAPPPLHHQERLLDPHIGDLVEVAWKGKFRLESLDIYQGLAWWTAIVVDKSDGSKYVQCVYAPLTYI